MNTYFIGDMVYFYGIGPIGNKTQGKVVMIITKELLGYAMDHYIVEVSTDVGEYLVIRPAHAVFPNP